MKLDLKTIITLVMTLALVVFTFIGIIGPELFIATAGSVFAYYFNKDFKAGGDDNVTVKESKNN